MDACETGRCVLAPNRPIALCPALCYDRHSLKLTCDASRLLHSTLGHQLLSMSLPVTPGRRIGRAASRAHKSPSQMLAGGLAGITAASLLQVCLAVRLGALSRGVADILRGRCIDPRRLSVPRRSLWMSSRPACSRASGRSENCASPSLRSPALVSFTRAFGPADTGPRWRDRYGHYESPLTRGPSRLMYACPAPQVPRSPCRSQRGAVPTDARLRCDALTPRCWPLAVTVIARRPRRNIPSAMSRIVQTEGVSALWHGW